MASIRESRRGNLKGQQHNAPAAYKLKMTFNGLCPFVPGEEPEDNPRPRWVGSFLVKADSSRKKYLTTKLPDHFPFLKFNMSDLEGSSAYPKTPLLVSLKFFDMVIVPPDGRVEELRIDFSGKLGKTPGEGETHFFDWVPRLDKVAPALGRVHANCFSDDKRRLRERLFARVHLTQGRLQTGDVGRVGDDGKPVVVRLRKGGIQQAVANHVILTLGCAAGPLKIKLRPFGGSDNDVKVITFRQPDKRLNIEVLNQCCMEDMFPQKGSGIGGMEAFDPDEDFRWNYAILADVDEIANVPIPLPIPMEIKSDNGNGKGSGGGTDAAKCSPPRTQAASEFVDQMLTLVSQISTVG